MNFNGLSEVNFYNIDDNDEDLIKLQKQADKEIEDEKRIKEKQKKIDEQKILSKMQAMEKEKTENEKIIDQRLFEYKCAEKYFEKNGLLEQQESTMKILKKIEKEKKNCEYGNWKEFDMDNLPDIIRIHLYVPKELLKDLIFPQK